MISLRSFKTLGPVLALPLAMALPALSQASFVSCTGTDYDITANVSPSSDCTILAPEGGNANDFVGGNDPSKWTVNEEAFFGFDNWSFDGKYDSEKDDDGDTVFVDGSTLFTFTGDGQDGTFSYRGSKDAIDNFMFVLKDGAKTNLTAYLIDMEALLNLQDDNGNGTYSSPFDDPPFPIGSADGPKDISHISVYSRTTDGLPPVVTSEPGTLALIGLGLLALAMIRRRTFGSD